MDEGARGERMRGRVLRGEKKIQVKMRNVLKQKIEKEERMES